MTGPFASGRKYSVGSSRYSGEGVSAALLLTTGYRLLTTLKNGRRAAVIMRTAPAGVIVPGRKSVHAQFQGTRQGREGHRLFSGRPAAGLGGRGRRRVALGREHGRGN